ncbi:MAG: MMPL family transporter [Pseudomonadales bacterium]|nr:MMPL family transporter [Pseudomonadales bacterium]
MATIRQRLEQRSILFSNFIFDHAKVVLALSLLLLIVLSVPLSRLEIDMSTEATLHSDDPVLLNFRQFQQDFGRDDMIIIGIEAPQALNDKLLQSLLELQQALENEVPYLKEVNTLHNVRNTYGTEDDLVVEELLENWPQRTRSNEALYQLATQHSNYRGNVMAADGSMLILTLELQTQVAGQKQGFHSITTQETEQAIQVIQDVLQRFEHLQPVLTGTAVILSAFNAATMADTIQASAIATLAIIVMLAVFFRRVSAVVLPLLIIEFSILSILGLMALMGVAMKGTTNGIIVLMFAVGACDAIHVLAHFYKALEQNQDKRAAIAHAIAYSAPAILLTSITTAAGFLSFAFAELSMISELGIFASIAVLFALFYTFTFLPAVLALCPINPTAKAAKVSLITDKFLRLCARCASQYPKQIVTVFLLLGVAAASSLPSLRFSNDVVSYFPDQAIVKQHLNIIDTAMSGSAAIEIVIDTGEEFGLYNPAFLQRLEGEIAKIENQQVAGIDVSRVFSLVDIIKEIHQALNNNEQAFYQLPDGRNLIAQEILLFENSGSDDLNRVADSDLRLARVTIKTPYADGVEYKKLVDHLRKQFQQAFVTTTIADAQPMSITVTGSAALVADTIPKALNSMAVSYVVAFTVISFFMMLMAGDWRIGLLSMIPNVLPIIFGLSVMVIFDLPLDMTSIMVGCIALGIVVDDTLHFIYHYSKYYQASGSASVAIEKTLQGAGRAMLITTLVLTACFSSDIFATLSNVVVFGTVICVIIILALLTDLLLAPALMMLLHGDEAAVSVTPNDEKSLAS